MKIQHSHKTKRAGIGSRPSARYSGPASNGVGATILAIALIAAAILCFVALLRPRPCRGPGCYTPPLRVEVFADVSASESAADREAYLRVLRYLIDLVFPRGTQVDLYLFDRTITSVYAGVPSESKDMEPACALIKGYSTKGEGTFPHLALKALLDTAHRYPNEPIACLLLTDGEDASPSKTATQIQALVNTQKLAGIWEVGAKIQGGLRSVAEQEYKALGTRFVISSDYGDAMSASRRFAQMISQ